LYAEQSVWHVNTGGETIHAKRMPGKFRTLKWLTASAWLIFFLGPYLRWGDRQAVLLDIPNRKFHIFDITIMPQDIWMLSLTLLFFAILLAVVTSIAGRVFCGFFCFQTIWTDVFTWIEDKIEGNPAQRRKLDKAPMSLEKLKVKVPKHAAWLVISMLTGISFAAWFTDVFELWKGYLTLSAPTVAWAVLGLFTAGTYGLAGFMREQVCFWLCPYARIQGVMYDRETILPAYDRLRGEPRGKMKKGAHDPDKGDCIDCGQCVAVCPTGIDIRDGQQEGCITCGLCIDACDSVMAKIDKPLGLVRYASFDELEGKPAIALFKRPRVLVYITILTLALGGILYGLSTLAGIELKVLHERQPLFVQQSDGSIQNKYYLKILNKTDQPVRATLTAEGPDGLTLVGGGEIELRPGDITPHTVYVRVPRARLKEESTPVMFRILATEDPSLASERESVIFGPR
jgi:cytochrome c oxidase accessory protein FixG